MKTKRKPTESEIIYKKTLNEFEKLIKSEIEEVIINKYELYKLDYICPSLEFIYDNNAAFICAYVNGRYNNCVDILRNFCKQHNIIQTEDFLNDVYIFRLGDDKE